MVTIKTNRSMPIPSRSNTGTYRSSNSCPNASNGDGKNVHDISSNRDRDRDRDNENDNNGNRVTIGDISNVGLEMKTTNMLYLDYEFHVNDNRSNGKNVFCLNKGAEGGIGIENDMGLNKEPKCGVSIKIELEDGKEGPDLNLITETDEVHCGHDIEPSISSVGSGNKVPEVQVGTSLASDNVVNVGNREPKFNFIVEFEMWNDFSVNGMMEELEVNNEVDCGNDVMGMSVGYDNGGKGTEVEQDNDRL